MKEHRNKLSIRNTLITKHNMKLSNNKICSYNIFILKCIRIDSIIQRRHLVDSIKCFSPIEMNENDDEKYAVP